MNPHREALLEARELMDAGYPFICVALGRVAESSSRLEPACDDLKARITKELGAGQTLGTWLEKQGVFYDRRQNHPRMCRLAWIDRMLEDYPTGDSMNTLPYKRYAHVDGFVDADYVEFLEGAERGHGVWDGKPRSDMYSRAEAEHLVKEGVWVEVATPMTLHCLKCDAPHIDEGEWATRLHKTHQCQACKHEWRPHGYPTVGVPSSVFKQACRDDGRCQYAIDHGAEGMAACPVGKCCTPGADLLAKHMPGYLAKVRAILDDSAERAPEWKGKPYSWFHEKTATSHRTSFPPTKDCFPLYTEQHVQERVAAALEVAQPAAQGDLPWAERIDTPEYRKLLGAVADAGERGYSHGEMDEEKWIVANGALIAHISKWGARQRQEGRREELAHQLARIRHLEIERDSALAGARAQYETNVALVAENCALTAESQRLKARIAQLEAELAGSRAAAFDEMLRELRQFRENLAEDSAKRPGISRALNILDYLKDKPWASS